MNLHSINDYPRADLPTSSDNSFYFPLQPKFHLGNRVRWKPMPSTDWGTISGLQYAWANHLSQWQWKYLVWLDPDSPSRAWTPSDWGWQDDLEPLKRLSESVH